LGLKEEKLKKLEALAQREGKPTVLNNEITVLERQKESLEQMLLVKESELHAAESKINDLLNGNGIS
jgi:hypothetical protein